MKFQNVDFPAPERDVRALVEMGTEGVNLTSTFVRLIAATHALSGRAYRQVPKRATDEAGPISRYMILLRVGPDAALYPADNNHYKRKFFTDLRLTETERRLAACAFAVKHAGEVSEYVAQANGSGCMVRCFQVDYRECYGGRRSPLVRVESWQEALVAIAAHEAYHIHQFRTSQTASESQCERFAAARLAIYRALTA